MHERHHKHEKRPYLTRERFSNEIGRETIIHYNRAGIPEIIEHHNAPELPSFIRYSSTGRKLSEMWGKRNGRGFEFHRDVDQPALVIHADNGNKSSEFYYENNRLHREVGPAVIYYDHNTQKITWVGYYIEGCQTGYKNLETEPGMLNDQRLAEDLHNLEIDSLNKLHDVEMEVLRKIEKLKN